MRSSFRRMLLLSSAMWAIAGCASMRAGDAGVEAAPERAGDSVQVERSTGVLQLSITSPFGIGRARLRLRGDAAVLPVVLRLRYTAQRPFERLEGLEVDGQRLEVATTQQDGWMQLQLPAATFRAGQQHELQWVDAYRR